MVRITKVYTKQGDRGRTRLAGGHEIAKDDPRIDAYGTVDELNACLGLAAEAAAADERLQPLLAQLRRLQNELFDLGAQLAILPEDRRPDTPEVSAADVARLEQEMDAMNEHLPPLTSFILPGGGEVGARLHLCRTVARRAERLTVALARHAQLEETMLVYLNRLSDWFFIAGRWAAATTDTPETLWRPGGR